jgi:hypothetical protein
MEERSWREGDNGKALQGKQITVLERDRKNKRRENLIQKRRDR